MSTSASGLRERKKARTRAEIRAQGLRLFAEQGYHETTTEQIAAAADVSPSTFFRYFPTKERIVLADDLEEVMVAAFAAQPRDLPVFTALARAIESGMAELNGDHAQERRRLISTVPELQLARLADIDRMASALVAAASERVGLGEDPFEARILAGALGGAVKAAAAQPDHKRENILRAIRYLEQGFPLAQR
jgi:AcrR family transcriptional regulator